MGGRFIIILIALFCTFISTDVFSGGRLNESKKELSKNQLLHKAQQLPHLKPYQCNFWEPYPVLKNIAMTVLDWDNDGIPNRLDECPTFPGVSERNGCPDIDMTKIITVACPTIIFTDEEFANVVHAFAELKFDGGTLLAVSHEMLDKFIALAIVNSKWKIDLSVYVDEVEDKEVNLDLSKRRLEEVRKYFELNGINKKRITGAYFGDDMPVLDLPPTRFEVELSE